MRSCAHCQVNQASEAAPLYPRLWPSQPWQRFHVDIAGPFQGSNFFMVIDADSKGPEIIVMLLATALATIQQLRHLFASCG